jgi:HD-GYP domain-containing protein (c-di-GMP phosphodiesterase class II)
VISKRAFHESSKTGTALSTSVTDLDGNVIVEKGTPLSRDFLKNVARSASTPPPFVSIADQGDLWKDLNRAITHPPYRTLFQKNGMTAEWQQTLRTTTLSPFIIDCLAFFKREDPYTYWHSLHVFLLTTYMAMELIEQRGWPPRFAAMGPLHDIGKINVPIEILTKTTPLTESERLSLHHHAAAGAILLSHYHGEGDQLGPVVALEHHERRDGSGYPFGIAASNPIVEMVAMCDVYDALISPRPYRNRPYDLRTGLEMLTQMTMEGRFSMDTLRFMIYLHRRSDMDYRSIEISKGKRGFPPEKNLYGVTIPDD